MSSLIETLAAELERPRELSARVINYIGGTYGVDHDAVGRFLVNELPKLEDYELDLILSPVFTPKLAHQAVFADLLGGDSVPREQWPALIQQLAARPTRAQLITDDGQAHSIPLREVTLERYVHRLRLDATIPESLFKLLDRTPPIADRPMLKAVARRAVWENDARRNILESHKPASVDDLVAWIPRRQEALQEQINVGSGPKPFFSGHAEELHGGERDQRQQADVRVSAKENELVFLNRLQEVLSS